MAPHEYTFTKTRIAPTPSGYLHLGNALSFAITAALAERFGAKILLRIDDLDRERADLKYVNDIFDTLNFLEIPWQEGPRDSDDFEKNWSQLHRMELYTAALEKLKENDDVFACTCSRAQIRAINANDEYPGTCRQKGLPLDTPHSSWRVRTDDNELNINTLEGMMKTALPLAMNDFVVRKKDGYPAYQLSSVIDDEFFGVDLIIRGQDLWPSTIAQIYLAEKLNMFSFLNARFYHHPLLMESAQLKLSKSSGATSVKHLRESGKSKADVFAMIASWLNLPGRPVNWRELIQLYGII